MTYQYTRHTARYKNSAGQTVNSPSSISLLSKEMYCQNSRLTNSVCDGGDRISIDYHYGTGTGANNLFLLATTFSSQHEQESFVTCYEYDKYGRQIGESQPKSGITVSQCNAKRGF